MAEKISLFSKTPLSCIFQYQLWCLRLCNLKEKYTDQKLGLTDLFTQIFHNCFKADIEIVAFWKAQVWIFQVNIGRKELAANNPKLSATSLFLLYEENFPFFSQIANYRTGTILSYSHIYKFHCSTFASFSTKNQSVNWKYLQVNGISELDEILLARSCISQWTHTETRSYWQRKVILLHGCWDDIVLTLCVNWVIHVIEKLVFSFGLSAKLQKYHIFYSALLQIFNWIMIMIIFYLKVVVRYERNVHAQIWSFTVTAETEESLIFSQASYECQTALL